MNNPLPPLDTTLLDLEHAALTNGKGFAPPARTSVAESIAQESRAPIDKLCSQMLGVIDEKITELKRAKTLIERERNHFHHRLDGIVELSNSLALCVLETQKRLSEIGEFTQSTPEHEPEAAQEAGK
jgi:hypothetical protein